MSSPLKQLADITLKIGSGATPLGGSEAYHEEGISLVRSLNVYDDGFRLKDLAFLDEVQAERLSNVELASGDVLLNITGASIARCCVVPDDVLPARVNQHVSIIRPDRKEIDPFYLRYQLISPEHKEALLSLARAGGSTREALTKAQIEVYRVSVPPLPVQQRIVTKLDAAFRALREVEGYVERNRHNARELFESYLNGVFEGKGDGWVEKRLGDLINIQNGYSFKSDEYADEGHFLMRISNVQDGEIILSKPKYVLIDEPRKERFVLDEGDILVSLTGNIGRVGVVKHEHLPAALNQRVARVTLKNTKVIQHNFLFFFLRSKYFRDHLQEAGHGAAQQNVSTSEIASVKLSVPLLAEQDRIMYVLNQLQTEANHLETTYEQKLLELGALKKSLLASAFRGEL